MACNRSSAHGTLAAELVPALGRPSPQNSGVHQCGRCKAGSHPSTCTGEAKDLDQWMCITLVMAVARSMKLPKISSVFDLQQVRAGVVARPCSMPPPRAPALPALLHPTWGIVVQGGLQVCGLLAPSARSSARLAPSQRRAPPSFAPSRTPPPHRAPCLAHGPAASLAVPCVPMCLQALKTLGGIAVDDLMAFELLWTPQVRSSAAPALVACGSVISPAQTVGAASALDKGTTPWPRAPAQGSAGPSRCDRMRPYCASHVCACIMHVAWIPDLECLQHHHPARSKKATHTPRMSCCWTSQPWSR